MRSFAALRVTSGERSWLSSLATRRSTAQALAARARIVLACAEDRENKAVAEEIWLDRQTVGKRRRRFLDPRVDGLHEDPRPGSPARSKTRRGF